MRAHTMPRTILITRAASNLGNRLTEHLDLTGELLAKHGAKLYLDQVTAKKEILKA